MPRTNLRVRARRLQGDDPLLYLRVFHLEAKLPAGIWFFSPPSIPFHDKSSRV